MKKHARGFTLLEIMVALAVFALLAGITGSAMYHAFDMRAKVAKQSDRLLDVQKAIAIISRDTEQLSMRPVRGNEMHLFPAFIGKGQYVEYTRGGLTNPQSLEQRSTLKRIALVCDGQNLIRRRFEVLDSTERTRFIDTVLIPNVTACRFEFLNKNLQSLTEWRATELPQEGMNDLTVFPKALQLHITLADWGNARFLFIIPEAMYGTS